MSKYKRLGDYIRQVDVRNKDLAVTRLLGVNLSKQFIPSVANTIGTDMSKYKVINKNQFGCKLMSVGRDGIMPISLYQEEKPALISSAYYVFEVANTDELIPYYLFLCLIRPEFDRQLTFYAGADVRGGVTWNFLCDMPISVPPIEEQRKIVAEYQAIEQRIANSRRLIATLEETAQTIYRNMFVDDIDPENLPEGWRMGTIGEFGMVVTGKTPSSNCPEDFGSTIDFITPSEFSGENFFCAKAKRGLSLDGIAKLQSKLIPKYSIAVTCIGSDMGKVRICPKECISNQQINSIIMSDKNKMPFLFFTLRNMKDYFQRIALGSSTMPMLSKGEFEKVEILIPDKKYITFFYTKAMPVIERILSSDKELRILSDFQSHYLIYKFKTI